MKCKCAFAVSLLLWSGSAQAYRPFDGTDADVAETGKYELELGPGYLKEPGRRTLVAPWIIHNLGIAEGHELVLEGHELVRIGDGDVARSRLADNGIFLKSILRRGSLQERTGISVATELGALLPELHDARVGASFGTIFSQRFPDLALHLNVVSMLSRSHNYDLFVGLIVEGPARWPVRPVAEVYALQTFRSGCAPGCDALGPEAGLTRSVLVGAIAPILDGLVLDGGLRIARGPDGDAFEIRAGLTWNVRVFGREP